MIVEAIQLYSKHGFANTSFKMIADKCGVSDTAPIHHFKNKQYMFSAVVEFVMERAKYVVRTSYNENDNSYQRLKKYFYGYLTWSHIYKSDAEVFLLLTYYAAIESGFPQLYDSIVKDELKEIVTMIEDGIKNQEFPQHIEPDICAKLLFDGLVGLLVSRLSGRYNPQTSKQLETKIQILIQNHTKHVGN